MIRFFVLFVPLCGQLLLWSPALGQAVLNADGPGNTYELINSVFAPNGGDVVEHPECAHPSFGRHIAEVWDATLGQYVFEFYIHRWNDNDRCINFDRQRMEIKTYDASPDSMKGVVGETITYRWKFRLAEGFQPSTSFTHLHQIKPVGGDDGDPLFTLTARKASPNRMELRHNNSTNVATEPLTSFLGVWVECTETITVGSNGAYEMTVKRVSDGATLMSYSSTNIMTIRPDNGFIRPKWGIYRSLLDSTSLRDDTVRFNAFSIKEEATPLPVHVSDVEATASANDVEIRWTTATESMCYGYEVERRTIAVSGSPLNAYAPRGFVPGAGTSTSPRSYRFIDRAVAPGRYAYRIKQVDTNGTFSYHAEMEVDVKGVPLEFALRAYPNPFNPSTTVEFSVPREEEVAVEVFDASGRSVALLFRGRVSPGIRHQAAFDGGTLASGTYLVRLSSAGNVRTTKVTLMR